MMGLTWMEYLPGARGDIPILLEVSRHGDGLLHAPLPELVVTHIASGGVGSPACHEGVPAGATERHLITCVTLDITHDTLHWQCTDLGVGVGEDQTPGGQFVQVGGDHGHRAEAVLGLQDTHIWPEVVCNNEQHILLVTWVLAEGRDDP